MSTRAILKINNNKLYYHHWDGDKLSHDLQVLYKTSENETDFINRLEKLPYWNSKGEIDKNEPIQYKAITQQELKDLESIIEYQYFIDTKKKILSIVNVNDKTITTEEL